MWTLKQFADWFGARSGVGHIREVEFNAVNHRAKYGTAVRYVDVSETVREWPSIDLLKCDVEGSEYEFLRTYPDVMVKTKAAVIEFHNTSYGSHQYRKLLAAYGFIHQKVLRVFGDNTVELFWQ